MAESRPCDTLSARSEERSGPGVLFPFAAVQPDARQDGGLRL